METIIGIDNGLNGAVVAIDGKTGHLVDYYDTPTVDLPPKKGKKTKRRIFAVAEMVSIIREFSNGELTAYIEYAQPMPKQGVSSTFATGFCFGLWQGILSSFCIPYEIVHPRVWTSRVLSGPGDTKSKSMMTCQRLFPKIPLMRPAGRKLTLDGRSDAALIAYYGFLMRTGR